MTTQPPKAILDEAEKAAEEYFSDTGPGYLGMSVWMEAVRWLFHHLTTMGAAEFDEKAIERKIERECEKLGDWHLFTAGEKAETIDAFTEIALWQHQRSAAQIAALKAENEFLNQQNEMAEKIWPDRLSALKAERDALKERLNHAEQGRYFAHKEAERRLDEWSKALDRLSALIPIEIPTPPAAGEAEDG